ncbi:MAG: hypothetical protein ACREHD_11785 [Pirellulales bacterium]
MTTVDDQTVREQNGDPRFLNIAWRVAEREDRLWMRNEDDEQPSPVDSNAAHDGARHGNGRRLNEGTAGKRGRLPYDERFPYLPAGLCDLEQLACGLSPGGTVPVSTLFEQPPR